MKLAILSNGNANYSTKRLVEEAEKKGHEVSVIKYKKCYALVAENKPVVMYKGDTLGRFDAIIPRIASSMTRYGTAILRQMEMQGMYSAAGSLAITRARDKIRSAQILARSGVPIPKTVFSRDTADIDGLIDSLGLPVIIKLAYGTHGNGVVLAESRKTAKSALQAFYLTNEDGTSVLVQEFIKESAGTDIRAFVVGSEVVASMQRQSLDDEFRSNLHKGGEGVPVELTEKEKRVAVLSAKAVGLNIAGVDLMRSSRGPLVLEVNASPGFGIEKVTGVNVAKAIVEYVEINALRKKKRDKVGA